MAPGYLQLPPALAQAVGPVKSLASYYAWTPPPSSPDPRELTADITRKGNNLLYRGNFLKYLGRGSFQRVFAHPTRNDLCLKLFDRDFDAMLMWGESDAEIHAANAATAEHLQTFGIGPALMLNTEIEGTPLLVMERIHGPTLKELADHYAFGPDEARLLLQLLGTMICCRINITDWKPENVMIGKRYSDAATRAYIVDGDCVKELGEDQAPDEAMAELLNSGMKLKNHIDVYNGHCLITTPVMDFILDNVHKHQTQTPWKRFFWGAAELFSGANIGRDGRK